MYQTLRVLHFARTIASTTTAFVRHKRPLINYILTLRLDVRRIDFHKECSVCYDDGVGMSQMPADHIQTTLGDERR